MGPSSTAPTITASYVQDNVSGVGIFDIPDGLDLASFEESDVGVQVLVGETWTDSILVSCDVENPTSFYAVFESPGDLEGLSWRLVSPVTGWTVGGGKPLQPTTGTFAGIPEGMAAKIADISLLTGTLKRR